MISFIFGVLFAGVMLLLIGLQRTYSHYPAKELKRRARAGEPLAKLLYQPVSYGVSLQLLLWGLIILTAALSFVLLADSLAPWFAVALIAFLVWLGFLWLPEARLTAFSEQIARVLTPAVTWLLQVLDPVLRRITSFVRRHRHISIRTGLYEKDDIIELLDRQSLQADNRITAADLDLTRHALQFSDKTVDEVLVPRRVVKAVATKEAIGPKLMDELYKSGYSRFPVYEDDSANIVATLYLKDLVKRSSGGHVRDAMRREVYYIHEDFTLPEALQAFLKTKHHLFIVVNEFEEYVGIVTIEDILEQVIGKQIVDEFDAYDDMRAVAAAAAKKDSAARKKAKATAEQHIDPETTVEAT